MSTITVVLGGQHIDFEITHYCPGSPATRWEPETDESIEWQAADPAIQVLIDHFGLHESMEELIVEQAKKDRADAEYEVAI